MEFGSLKYGLPRRSAPRNDVLCLPAPCNDVNTATLSFSY